MTPSQLAEHAAIYGEQAARRARVHARNTLERMQAWWRRALRKPLPFGLPPLGEVDKYRELAKHPSVLGAIGFCLSVFTYCFVRWLCRLCNTRRNKHYRMYTPIEGDPFDELEQESLVIVDEGVGHVGTPKRPFIAHF